MQLAGQICGHIPQATHLARPCSSVSMRCVPRQRGESVQSRVLFSSGYCIVTLGRNKCCSVSTMPLRDRKSTRLNSSHGYISYAVFCLKKKNNFDNVSEGTGTLRGCLYA